jgi:phage portal protein BeeE
VADPPRPGEGRPRVRDRPQGLRDRRRQDEVLSDDEILHLPGLGYDGICGVSPIRAARESIGLGLAAQEYGAKLFGSGSLATGILQTEQRLTQKQADTLSKRWKEKRTGLGAAHETIVLDKGAKFHQLTIPPEDAQFLESRRFQVTEVCRWFGIPPFLMFETEKSTSWGTGLEQQALGWVKFDLLPELTAVEQRVTKHVLKPQPVYAHYSSRACCAATRRPRGLLQGDVGDRRAVHQRDPRLRGARPRSRAATSATGRSTWASSAPPTPPASRRRQTAPGGAGQCVTSLASPPT